MSQPNATDDSLTGTFEVTASGYVITAREAVTRRELRPANGEQS